LSRAGHRTGLVIAHPGHELRLSHWVAARRPTVHILTAGSRNGDDGTRVEASRRLAARLGATPGEVFGQRLDREVYAWIMAGDPAPFAALADELAESFVRQDLTTVVTDAWQLYNPVHDLWRLTAQAAASLASERLARPVQCLDYPVVPRSMAQRSPGPLRLEIRLSPDEVDAKLALAADYPAIAGEVAELLAAGGRGFLASETLHDPRPLGELTPAPGEVPLYEQYGEARVAAGRYGAVLRWRHVAPIAAALGAVLGDTAAAA